MIYVLITILIVLIGFLTLGLLNKHLPKWFCDNIGQHLLPIAQGFERMPNYKEREAIANVTYQQGLENVKTKPVPKGQKFLPGTRVKIVANLGSAMSHFPSGKLATVKYTYAHAYPDWGGNIQDYCLDIDGIGEVSWYHESQLEGG